MRKEFAENVRIGYKIVLKPSRQLILIGIVPNIMKESDGFVFYWI